MTVSLDTELLSYQAQRERLVGALEDLRRWLGRHAELDAAQTVRLFDLTEDLKKDRLILAFVAEFSRGKTELINSLFFSDYGARLLPSDAGRTTMCPTEIFHDQMDEPYLRLLPIESRLSDESIAVLKRRTIEWTKVRLDPYSPSEMADALRRLADVKRVTEVQARALGLWDADDPSHAGENKDGMVEVPAWRYALVNFPHPLLTGGLTILDTPGLNTLGSEPELTLSTIPSAHAVLFLLATDTGVTRSDMEIWRRCVRKHSNRHIAVLNKVDMLWDDLNSREVVAAMIERQAEATARTLGIPRRDVLTVSAQKALLGRIRGDRELVSRSGIGELEHRLATEIIPAKRTLIQALVVAEAGALAESARRSVETELFSLRRDHHDLTSLAGKDQEIVGSLHGRLSSEKIAYDKTVNSFNVTRKIVAQQGQMLIEHLAPERVERLISESLVGIETSWTTAALLRGMQSLFDRALAEFREAEDLAVGITGLLRKAYRRFHDQHGLPLLVSPELILEGHRLRMEDLVHATREFCADPLNIVVAKGFLVRKFYVGLVTHARKVFDHSRREAESWLRQSMDPLVVQIREFKHQIEVRLDGLGKVHRHAETLESRVATLQSRIAILEEEARYVADIEARVRGGAGAS
jgi:predicted  nucleic acid-binding Zn-ribbon protein